MADTRTLKLSLLADVNKFLDGMNKAETGTKTLGSKVGKYSKAMAGAFLAVGAAAGVMAVKIGVDSVKAAIEDEKSSRLLQLQLQKTLGANDKLVNGVEDYISATQIRVGVQDDKLRPSLARLVRSTKDAGEAQKLLNLALDISVATGKPLETVSNALGKAYDGNAQALGRLGLGIDSSILKSNDFDKIGKELTKTFGGFADKEAKTLDGQLRIVNITFDELKENLGKKLLPILGDVLKSVIKVSKAFSGEDPDGLSARARELKGEMGDGGEGSLGRSLAILAVSFSNLFSALSGSASGKATSTLENFANALNNVANAINWLATAYGKLDKFTKSKGYQTTLDALFGPVGGFGKVAPGTKFGNQALGGPVSGTHSYLVGERGPEIFTPNVGGKITPNGAMGGGTVINLNGIVDAESARRSIEQLIQRSARRTGAIDWVGATL